MVNVSLGKIRWDVVTSVGQWKKNSILDFQLSRDARDKPINISSEMLSYT